MSVGDEPNLPEDGYGPAMKRLNRWLAAIGGILALLVSWQVLGWPRPATTWDIARVREQLEAKLDTLSGSVLSNSRAILEERWWRRTKEIEELQDKLALRPGNGDLRRQLSRTEREREAINSEIQRIEDGR